MYPVNTALVVQEDHYYPFGMRLSGMSGRNGQENKFLYNGKEHEEDFDLNWYHYGVRYYDPQLGRWHAVDPADEFFSPYVYCHNDPINFLDPDGAETHCAQDGTVMNVVNDWSNAILVHPEVGHEGPANLIGYTSTWDEFICPETGGTFASAFIDFGQSWDATFDELTVLALPMSPYKFAMASKWNGSLDLKNRTDLGVSEGTAKLFHGKYRTARSMGNLIFGYNVNKKYPNLGYQKMMKMAGYYEKTKFAPSIGYPLLLNWSPWHAPYWGEDKYSGRNIRLGWNLGEVNRL